MKLFISRLKEDLYIFRGTKDFKSVFIKFILHPRVMPVLLLRISELFHRKKLGFLAKLVSLLNRIIFGCDIACKAEIGGGLYLPHPCGIVIGEYAKIGRFCVIYQGVTVGERGESHESGTSVIGDYVELGAGAKILGKVKIGNYCRIGANAVVLKDVEEKGIAVGIPAKIVDFRNDV